MCVCMCLVHICAKFWKTGQNFGSLKVLERQNIDDGFYCIHSQNNHNVQKRCWGPAEAWTQHRRESRQPRFCPFLQTSHGLSNDERSSTCSNWKMMEKWWRNFEFNLAARTCQNTNWDVHLCIHVHLDEAVLLQNLAQAAAWTRLAS